MAFVEVFFATLGEIIGILFGLFIVGIIGFTLYKYIKSRFRHIMEHKKEER